MRGWIRGGLLTLLLLTTLPADAAAALGWIEKLSGPGDFVGPEALIPFACYGERRGGRVGEQLAGTSPDDGTQAAETERRFFLDWDCRFRANMSRPRVILGVDLADLRTSTNPVQYGAEAAPSVRLFWVIPTAMVPVHPTVRVGAGFGFGRFSGSGDAFDPFWRALFQPVRVSVTPLRVFGKRDWLEFLQIHGSALMILGDIRASDFGGTGPLRESNEIVPHVEIAIDLGLLADLWKR